MQSMSGPEFREEMLARAQDAMRRHRRWYMVEGVVLIVLGVLAVLLPQVATLAATVLVGWLFLAGGAIRVAATISRRDTPGYRFSILTGALAALLGLVLLVQPFAGALTLTMVLVALFVFQGVMSIVIAMQFRRITARNWAFMIASGVVDLVLAGIILAGWPGTATWAIGLILGINLIFLGLALTMTAGAIRD